MKDSFTWKDCPFEFDTKKTWYDEDLETGKRKRYTGTWTFHDNCYKYFETPFMFVAKLCDEHLNFLKSLEED